MTNNVSLISLKNKGHVNAAESHQSSVKLGNGGSGQVSHSLIVSPSQSGVDVHFSYNKMITDQSITNLASMPFISDGNQSRNSINDVSSAALAQASTQANLSVFKQKKARKAR